MHATDLSEVEDRPGDVGALTQEGVTDGPRSKNTQVQAWPDARPTSRTAG